jgi:hypothetical protein
LFVRIWLSGQCQVKKILPFRGLVKKLVPVKLETKNPDARNPDARNLSARNFQLTSLISGCYQKKSKDFYKKKLLFYMYPANLQ